MKRIAPLLLLLVQLPLEAQEPQASRTPAPRRVLGAAPLTGDVRIDGRFDEPAWSAAEVATGFTQAYPRPGAPASEGTEVRVLAGPDALYVAARMLDSRPDSIVAPLARRDAAGIYTDQVQVSIDSRNDRRTAFLFSVNPRGVKRDVFLYDDTREDASWDAVWDVATAVDSAGWTAEFRIPYSQLRFSGGPADGRVWGLGVMRDLARKEERSTWSPWTRNSPGFVSSHGELAGLAGIRAPGRLEVLPYTSARLERAPGDRANPFYDANDWASSVGADVQYGVPGGLTLTATVNPDFGQVEVDPADVNLTAFETFFTERRPFFVEGSDIFRFGQLAAGNTYGFSEFFYSRRIGRPPQRVLGGPDVLQVDAPEQSTILAAAKLSGKTAGGWSVGLMDAVTSREEARYLTASGERSAPVEPLSNYLVGRLRRDLDRGNTVLGGIATATHRDLGGSEFDALLRSRAMLAGVDAQHSWKSRAWTASGYLAGTRVEGSRQVITGAQTSSARYYQRPDADYIRLDSTRTALDGYTGAAAIRHTGSWDASLAYQAVSPGFEVNDLGFQGRTDSHAVSTFLGHRINRPGRVFRDKLLALYAQHAWNFGGNRITETYTGNVYGTFHNLWSVGILSTYGARVANDRLTRGGPLSVTPSQWYVSTQVSSDRRRAFSGTLNASHRTNTEGEYENVASVSGVLRPNTSLRVTLGPSIRSRRDVDQYVLSRADPLAAATGGTRYVFANLDQTILSLDTRVDWTFTPELSLQVFAQPFVNSADFRELKEFRTPGTADFDVYGRDVGTLQTGAPCGTRPGQAGVHTIDPDGAGPASCFQLRDQDFNFRSLRGNAVLRWEYRPGSALFLVWQQLRSGRQAFGDFELGRDVGGIFDEPARNVFLLKVTYWLSR